MVHYELEMGWGRGWLAGEMSNNDMAALPSSGLAALLGDPP